MVLMQTMRLFRKKEDDLDALVILEFFKFVGFLVTDYVLDSRRKYPKMVFQNYNLNIFYKLSGEETLRFNEEVEGSIWINGNTLDEVFNEILKIKKLGWNNDSIKSIIDIFKEKRLPVVFYNLGNMKFVHEYYSQEEKREKIAKSRDNVFKSSYIAAVDCFDKIAESMAFSGLDEFGVYSEYAFLNIKYIINQILYLWKDTQIFDVDILREYSEEIREKAPDLIRLDYLTGFICIQDNRYLGDGEGYFMNALQKAIKMNVPEELRDFLYYQLGRFCEKIRKDINLANFLYNKAYSEDRFPFSRALYKIIKRQEREEDWNGVADYSNKMIELVLNGYDWKMLMPREQLYMYKTYMLLGLAFYKLERYNLAILSYENAVKMAEISLNYNEDVIRMGYGSFLKMAEISISKRRAYLKIIECYSKYGNNKAIEEWQKRLDELE